MTEETTTKPDGQQAGGPTTGPSQRPLPGDVINEFRGPNPSRRTQIDGATEITDLDRTEDNKAIVREMMESCLFPGARPDRVERWFVEPYLQHNPDVRDRLDTSDGSPKERTDS